MSSRTLRFIAEGLAALAVIQVALTIPVLLAARRSSEPPFHDTYVQDMSGLPWWALPTALLLIAVALFVWSRRVST